jgi:hypothetical protein
MRHHALKFAIVEQCLDKGVIEVFKIPTADNVSDMGTKSLYGEAFDRHVRNTMGEAEK